MSMKITLDTRDYDVKMRIIQKASRNFTPRVILESSQLINDIMRETVPVDTGLLRNTIQQSVFPTRAVIETTTGYGKFVDEDTQEHDIVARFAKALRFEIAGKVFFRKKVTIPARTGVQFRRKTLDIAFPQLFNLFARVWRELTK